MKVVILAGGQGTRLREETEYRPKPMVEIGGKPVLWHIMKIYSHYGFNDFVVCLGYKGNMIKQYFLDYKAMNSDFTIDLDGSKNIIYFSNESCDSFKVTLANTGIDTMTGGRVKRIKKYIDTDNFMVTYGDGLADINIGELLKFHNKHKNIATVSAVRPISRFGVLHTDTNGQVKSFVEKPAMDGWINAGYFVFKKSVFDYLENDDTVLEQEPLFRLANENNLSAYFHKGSFHVMDTYREYLYLNELWKEGKAPWKVWDN